MELTPINWNEVPEVITKEQLWRLCHISKSTARFLLKSGKIPCQDSGKKTRRCRILKSDVLAYLEDRERCPEFYKASREWYATNGKCTNKKQVPVIREDLHEYGQFNVARPADFAGHSLSVSDIVAVKQGGDISYHYCDNIGFKEMDHFKPENPLKNAEMAMEDDYGMIDGIINNGSKQEAEPQKKPSILEKLRQPVPERTPKTTAQNKRAEMEI